MEKEEEPRRFQRDYLNTWLIRPCTFCDGAGRVINENRNIVCLKCKGRKVE